jgi:inorganic phosphate transporter, PiT family
MNIEGEQLTAGLMGFAATGICISLFFEFINGFHDTANAVATVIYTHSLPPTAAVIWSGIWNFIGVLLSSGTVAYSVVAILPPSLVLNVSSGTGAAALFALLLGAVIWNFGTWYFGMPRSSSHSLIGSILGVSLVYTLTRSKQGEGIHWDQAGQVLLSLLISPIVGFGAAALILLALHRFVKTPRLFEPADPEKSPPHWVRGLLIVTCTGVSFAHGSNDGQKGMGLLMLVLIVALPSSLALNLDMKPTELFANRSGLQKSTLRNILIAWVLTLPVCFFLGATIFAGIFSSTSWDGNNGMAGISSRSTKCAFGSRIAIPAAERSKRRRIILNKSAKTL